MKPNAITLLIVIYLFTTTALNVSAQADVKIPDDSVAIYLVNKKWYIQQMYTGKQTIVADKSQRGKAYFFFTSNRMSMKIEGAEQVEEYTLDRVARILTFKDGGGITIAHISKSELRLEVLEGAQIMGWLLRTTP